MQTAEEFIANQKVRFEKEKQKKKLRKMKDIGRKGYHDYLRTHWTFVKQHNNTQKVFVIERMELAKVRGKTVSVSVKDIGDIEYRIGYYIVGKNGTKKGKWTWGQYCPMIPANDLVHLIKKAVEEGTILREHFLY